MIVQGAWHAHCVPAWPAGTNGIHRQQGPTRLPTQPPTLTTKSLRDSLPPLLAARVSFSCCLHG